MNKDLAALSAEEIVALGSAAVDIAVGLGRHVTITGISTGGVLAAWLAYQRTDIKSIGLIAPVLGLSAVPPMLTGIATRFLLASPNQYMWWGDPEEIDQGALHAYPRFSTKALGQILRISAGVRRASRRGLPHCESIVVVDNDNDTGVSQPIIKKTIAAWQRRGAPDLRTYTFGREHQLDHDLIDPDHPQQNVALVYPKLLSLII
jgi:pimeloyl-ACP methyl ester carboxylesterase